MTNKLLAVFLLNISLGKNSYKFVLFVNISDEKGNTSIFLFDGDTFCIILCQIASFAFIYFQEEG
jgi:hypothetical protein